MNFISVNSISKKFNNIDALNNITFVVKKGELFGLIGPDGSGKSTLFRILTTLLLPTSGSAKIKNYDLVKDYKKIRNILGYMPGKFSLYQDLTVEENLNFFATVFGTTVKENYDLIKDIYIQIEPFKKRLAGHLSGGMKQKLALSCALIHKPEFLILDEPTTGVDALSRTEFWQLLKRLQNFGITIIVSTPYMDEANLCNNVALIQNGNILEIEKPENIIKNYKPFLISVKNNKIYETYELLKCYNNSYKIHLFGQSVHVSSDIQININDLAKYLELNKLENSEIKISNPTIEDCFLWLMKKNG